MMMKTLVGCTAVDLLHYGEALSYIVSYRN